MISVIPSSVKTLLQSKVIIGENAPTAEVTFEDEPTGGLTPDDTWTFETAVRAQASYDYSTPSFCVRPSDGKILATYYSPDQNKIFLSYVDSLDDLESSNSLSTNEWEFTGFSINSSSTKTTSGLCTRSKLITTSGGTLLLICYDPGAPSEAQSVKCFSSSNGAGTDFSELSTVYSVADQNKSSSYNSSTLSDIGTVHELSSGRIGFISGKMYIGVGSPWNLYCNWGYHYSYSDDDGATWSNVEIYLPTTGFTQSYVLMTGLAQFSNYLIALIGSDSGSAYDSCFYYSDDEGETWTKCDNYSPIAGEVSTAEIEGVSSDGYNNYMWHNSDAGTAFAKIYWVTKDTTINVSGQNPYDRTSFWTDFSPTGGDTFSANFQVEGHEYRVLACDRDTLSDDDSLVSITDTGTLAEIDKSFNSVVINRQKDAQSQTATIEFANGSKTVLDAIGTYSPESGVDSNWANILLPGKDVTIQMRYGSNLVTVFTGEIDDVNVNRTANDASMTIKCRDDGWNLIDRAIKNGSNYYVTYANKTPEYIVDDLLTKAGFTSISTETTGITIVDITFDRITYSEAIEQIISITGFDLVIYEDGSADFFQPNDRQPEIEDTIVLNGTTPEELSEYPIVTSTIQVWSGAGKTGTQYTITTDYTITEGDEDTPWEITRVGGGSIGDGATVYVSYVYAAWVFREGYDIFSLNYRYSRRNVFGSVDVKGKDDEDNVVSYTYSLPSPSSYGTVADKVLFITDESLDTQAKCQTAAEQVGANMWKQYREVTHYAIGVPYLQVGDTIKIIESSSGISEAYRIKSINLELTKDGMFMQIVTNYYGYTP